MNGLSIIRSLGRKGIPVIAVDYAKNAVGFSSKYTRKAAIAPNPRIDEAKFLHFLSGKSGEWSDSILIPTGDVELAVFSHHKDELSRYYILPVPDWEATKSIIDKKGTYDIATRLNIPIPKTTSIDSAESLNSLKSNVDYPCLLKPRETHEFGPKFGRKAFIIHSFDQLKMELSRAYQAGCHMMVQEIIPGPDNLIYPYVAYYDSKSEPLAEFTYRKIRQDPPFLGICRVGESTNTAEIIAPSRKILTALPFIGLCEIEYKKDPRDGRFKLLDINGRNTMQLGLSIKCGVDLPWIMYNDLVENNKLHISEYETGVKWINEIADITNFVLHRKQEKWTIREYLSPYFSRKTFAFFDRDDWRPAIKNWSLFILWVFKVAMSRKWRRNKDETKT